MTGTSVRDGLGERAVRGAAVTGVSQVIRLVIQVASVVTLARLLTPLDYGLVAMVLAVIGVADFLRDFGLGAAAVRAERLSRSERDNLFWINTGLGIAFTLLTMACAPLIATAYSRDQLTMIAVALAPSFALGGLCAQYRVDLLRRLRFGSLAVIEVACSAIALIIGIAMALAGAGYWALVTQQLSAGIIGLLLHVYACRWLPGRYNRSTPTLGFLRLGSAFMFGSVLAYISRNSDNVIIGHQFGANSLGIYTRSIQLVRTPLTQLQAPFATVALPVLVAAGVNDERLVSAARRGQTALAYPLMAVSAIVVASSTAMVDLALGHQWSEAAPIVAWVAAGGAVSCLTTPAMWLFSVRGLGRTITLFNLVATGLTVSLIVVGAQWGVEGVAAAVMTAGCLSWPVSLWFAHNHAGLSIRPLVWAGIRVSTAAATGAFVGRVMVGLMSAQPPWTEVAVAGTVVVVVFGLLMPIPGYRADAHELLSMARLLRPKRGAR